MEMCRDESCPVQIKDEINSSGMKTLKMCFGKGRMKHPESIEQGNMIVF